MHLAYLNQDKGIGPNKAKGARAHIESLVHAFERSGIRRLARGSSQRAGAATRVSSRSPIG